MRAISSSTTKCRHCFQQTGAVNRGAASGQGAAAEAQTGLTFRQQAAALPADRAALCALILVASLIPISKGAISEPFGVFTPRAERVNSRAAMLAIAALVWLEAQSGTPFF